MGAVEIVLAAAVLAAGGRWEHRLERWSDAADLAAGGLERGRPDPARGGVLLAPGGAWTSPPVDRREAPFHELLLSWNVDAPPGAGFRVELQVGQERAHGPSPVWSPWLRVEDRPARGRAPERGRRSFAGGRVDIDVFRGARPYAWARWRVEATGPPDGPAILLDAASLCSSRRAARPGGDEVAAPVARLAVPFRSQRALGAELADSICSPTSVAMVLAYRGVELPTAEVVDAVFDPLHGIWGNWPRNVQGAYELGVPGYLTRLATWEEVATHLRAGQPLVASIAAGEGELTGAPYPSTTGHLLCLVGLDERGDVLVSDPAAERAEGGERTYLREELERAWLDRGGTAYVLLPREAPGNGGR